MLQFDTYSIRPIQLNDIEACFNLIERNREQLRAYFPITTATCVDLDSTKNYILSRMERASKKEFITLVVQDEVNHHLIGVISIKDIDWVNLKSELGYFIDMNQSGKGIISKCIEQVVSFCFESLNLNKVFLRIAIDNISSRRVAEKNNFVLEGILNEDIQTRIGEFKVVAYYGLVATKSLST